MLHLDAQVFDREIGFVLDLCEALNTPRSLAVSLLIRSGSSKDYLNLFELPAPCDGGSVERYAGDYLVSTVLKKCETLPLTVNRKANALKAFYEAEELCARTNRRLLTELHPSWVETFSAELARILGPVTGPRGCLASLEGRFRHGPGAVVGIKGEGLVRSLKYDSTVTLTRSLSSYVRAIMGDLWFEHQGSNLQQVDGNEWVNVPKNALTDRGIAKEPLLNVYGQLAIGEFLSDRLRFFSINLADQCWNQTLAEMAYDWNLATIDLSMASDTLALQLVREFFPPEWQRILGTFRSPKTKVEGKWVSLEKFSSMGNGYTFQLESVVFYAVVRTFVPCDDLCFCGVYGDDIIVPQAYATQVIDALNFLGFKVNTSKSFLAGSFFESCGADFLRGRPVRPFFLRNVYESPVPKFLQWANGLRLWLWRVYGYSPMMFQEIWLCLIGQLNRKWRTTSVPPILGDIGIIRSSDEHSDRWKKDGWEGFAAKAVVFMHTDFSTVDRQSFGVLLAAYNDLENRRTTGHDCRETLETRGIEPIRGLYGRPITRLVHVRLWTTGAGWL